MAYQNGTTHYNLPQTIGTDKRDWSDTNKAFADVDAALYNAANGASINKTDIDKLKIDVAANTQQITTNTDNIATNTANIGTNTGNISKLQSDLQTAQTDLHNEIVDVRNDAEDMITAYNEPNATSAHKYAVGDYFIYNDILYKATQAIDVGNTIVPNTNCMATNVSTEIKNNSSTPYGYEQIKIGDADYIQVDTGKKLGDFCQLLRTSIKPYRSSLATGGIIAPNFMRIVYYNLTADYSIFKAVNIDFYITDQPNGQAPSTSQLQELYLSCYDSSSDCSAYLVKISDGTVTNVTNKYLGNGGVIRLYKALIKTN